MPVWMTKTGPHGSIQVFPEERIPLKNHKEKWVPGLRLKLQRAWATSEIELSDGTPGPLNPSGEFSRVAPEFIDSDHLPPGTIMDLKKAAAHRDGWKGDPIKALEKWMDGEEAKEYYQLERGDPRGQRPIKIKMTADDYAKFQTMKTETGLDTHEVVTVPPVETQAQKIQHGTRTVR